MLGCCHEAAAKSLILLLSTPGSFNQLPLGAASSSSPAAQRVTRQQSLQKKMSSLEDELKGIGPGMGGVPEGPE